MSNMTPKEIVSELDKYIIGQSEAKKSVAIALRNRWRRMQLNEPMRTEVTPKNILMIGPTGVGKTEIARRLAKLANAPFIKVEATKFTEVGYVGKEVDQIIRDLVDVSLRLVRDEKINANKEVSKNQAEDAVLDIIVPGSGESSDSSNAARQSFRKQLREGILDNNEIEVDVDVNPVGLEIMSPPGMEEMTSQLQSMFQNISGSKKKRKRMLVKDALKYFEEEAANKYINNDDVKEQAIDLVQQSGIVFIDEIDKICRKGSSASGSGEVSREGVQRDLLPLLEGSTVNTKHGMIKTDHILFITSGAFQLSKPSDLIPELQGRLPIRVELKELTADDFKRILIEPNYSLIQQQINLLKTEGVMLEFAPDGIAEIANAAYKVNQTTENIGARRLHTLMERIMEHVSYNASDMNGAEVIVNAAFVQENIGLLLDNEDLSRYIL